MFIVADLVSLKTFIEYKFLESSLLGYSYVRLWVNVLVVKLF